MVWMRVRTRDWILVMPKAKLVIGPFKNYVSAFNHWYSEFTEEQQQDWFIVNTRFWPKATARRDGWVTLMEPKRMRWSKSP